MTPSPTGGASVCSAAHTRPHAHTTQGSGENQQEILLKPQAAKVSDFASNGLEQSLQDFMLYNDAQHKTHHFWDC